MVSQATTKVRQMKVIPKRNIIDSCVHSTCELIGHLGTPEYCHGVNNFRDYLKLKVEEMSQDTSYYRTAQTIKSRKV